MEQLLMWALNGVLGILMTVLWYREREKDTRIKALETKLAETREQYVQKSDLKDLKSDINSRFDRLEDLIQKRS